VSDTRDPERDQPLPRPGRVPVQAVLIASIRERTEHGRRKYGTVLETDNGRDALQDAWEEALDLVTYLTQMRLERGDPMPGPDVGPEPVPGIGSVYVYGRPYSSHHAAMQALRRTSGPCPACGHARHEGLLAPCGAYAEGAVGCRCLTVVRTVLQTTYTRGLL
jgi:hypothetical protein